LTGTGRVHCTAVVQGGSAGNVATAAAVPLGTWTHVACTYDGAQLAVLIDGAVTTTAALTGLVATGSSVGLRVGQNLLSSGDEDSRFVGGIDDVRIWSVARQPAQICDDAGIACGP
jgi:hypothetical protein